jgi:nucleoside-triphosphatase
MTSRKKNILVTGLPGVGKTTLIKKVSGELRSLQPVGFYTAEIREKGVRRGFELISFDGRMGILSHTDIKGPYRVGKYGVDIKGFENFLESIPFLIPATNLIIIDEIGKMECLSHKFIGFIKNILDSGKQVIATIALKGSGLIEEIKKRDDVMLIEMTQSNRDALVSEVFKFLS